jgi:hypothetical protein
MSGSMIKAIENSTERLGDSSTRPRSQSQNVACLGRCATVSWRRFDVYPEGLLKKKKNKTPCLLINDDQTRRCFSRLA